MDESFQYCMDYDLWLKILKQGKAQFIPDNLAYYRFWAGSKTNKESEKFKEEENRIRKKYGGSVINPGAIHRWRYQQKWLDVVKKRLPVLFGCCKRFTYKIINLIKFKKN